ncbi:methylated-DNA--[protein]-cysteine S-methyltransferase [Dongia deserti]|uniref:methylated-DNA--[protein]-cysteine S-methyltransferase n=1 Tax=Dongia deserti TaxID=2268030 RepID=UPI000E64F0A3|nr:methylated-DNA--[protein]-cysteine S-methyltransferase [Dongia deserti]
MAKPLQLLIDRIKTPIGELGIVADENGALRAVEWTDHEHHMHDSLRLHYGKDGYELRSARNPAGLNTALRAYFDGELTAIDRLKVATGGTEFQKTVWKALRAIPCGETISYARLAEHIGRPKSVRAVGSANGDNPISVVVPCHRVIGTNGSLTGYGGGIERKRWLLAHERMGKSAKRSRE